LKKTAARSPHTLAATAVVVSLALAGGTSLALAAAPDTAGSIAGQPLPFVVAPNDGQWPAHVQFAGSSGSVAVEFGTSTVAIRRADDQTELVLRVVDWAATPEVRGLGRQAGLAHYFLGADPSGWRTGLATYAGVALADGSGRQLELRPQAQRLTASLRAPATARGLRAPGLEIQLRGPGRTRLPTRVPLTQAHGLSLGGRSASPLGPLGPWPGDLVLSAEIDYATYLGGTFDDRARSVALTDADTVYLAGSTASPGFPVADPLQPQLGNSTGDFDAFVSKLRPDGRGFEFSTYLGGNSQDGAYDLHVTDGVYVTGYAQSDDFPTAGAFQAANAARGKSDAFVTKLAMDGAALAFSTYLGGGGTDIGTSIASDASGRAAVAGLTDSSDLPTARAIQAVRRGPSDGFVARLSPDGGQLEVGTYLGGTGDDEALGVAASGDTLAVTGWTGSVNFPTTSDGDRSFGGTTDAFVATLDAAEDPTGPGPVRLSFSSFLGGSDRDEAAAIAMLSGDRLVVAGTTASQDFPVRDPFQAQRRGPTDGFLTIVAPGGTLEHSTFFGGSGSETAYDLAASGDRIAVAGETDSSNLPTTGSLQTRAGGLDAFVAVFAAGNLPFSTYFGGSGEDRAMAVAMRGDALVIAGETTSGNLPVKDPLQPGRGGQSDAFVTRLTVVEGTPDVGTVTATATGSISATPTVTATGPSPTPTASSTGATSTATATDAATETASPSATPNPSSTPTATQAPLCRCVIFLPIAHQP
jgi:hypothetical protein